MSYDLIIVGGGPGGVAAGIYASRKKIKSALITDSFGGQSFDSSEIQNWIGTKSISGYDLAKNLEEHLRAQSGVDIFDNDRVVKIEKSEDGFSATTKSGKLFDAKTILVVSGSHRKKLGVPGEKEFAGKGVAYCATCDAPLFADKEVAVVGGGNSALESAVDLISYASKIYLLARSGVLRGDPITQDKIKNNPKVEIMFGSAVSEIYGRNFVEGLKYQDLKKNEIKDLKVGGVFVEIGLEPNSDIVKDLVKIDDYGHIAVDSKTQQSSLLGIWAAGDVTDCKYRQNNISAGDAIKAVLSICDYLNKR